MEECKTVELSIEETKIYAENYNNLKSKPKLEKLFNTRRQSNNSTCSSAITLASGSTETPQSCGSICVFNLSQKLIFNCEFCDLKYGDLDNFGRHLLQDHILLLQNCEPEKENSDKCKGSSISSVVKKEPLEPAIDLPPSYFTEPLVSCGSIFILKQRKFLMACGYCDCSKYDNLKMFEKHIKQQHYILEGAHNVLNVVPKVETIKEEFFVTTELEEAKIKEEQEVEQKIKAEIKKELKSEEDEEVESGEEFQYIESGEEEHKDDKEIELDYKEYVNDGEITTSSTTKRKRFSSPDQTSGETVHKKDTTQKRKKNEVQKQRDQLQQIPQQKQLLVQQNQKQAQPQVVSFIDGMAIPASLIITVVPQGKLHQQKTKLSHHQQQPPPLQKTPSQTSVDGNTINVNDPGNLAIKLSRVKRVACTCPNCVQGENNSVRKKQHNCHIPDCNRVFAKASVLRSHLRWHTGERTFVCSWPLCGKSFLRSDERLRHHKTHTGEKHLQCPECDKKFMRSDHLTKHIKTH